MFAPDNSRILSNCLSLSCSTIINSTFFAGSNKFPCSTATEATEPPQQLVRIGAPPHWHGQALHFRCLLRRKSGKLCGIMASACAAVHRLPSQYVCVGWICQSPEFVFTLNEHKYCVSLDEIAENCGEMQRGAEATRKKTTHFQPNTEYCRHEEIINKRTNTVLGWVRAVR